MTDAKDKRLRKTYGISLAEYNEMLKAQGGRCWICGRKAAARSLSVDHDHSYRYVKVGTAKVAEKSWRATARYLTKVFTASGMSKPDVVGKIRTQLKKSSVRALLCCNCNRGLAFYYDNGHAMHNASVYLKLHKSGEAMPVPARPF